MYNTMIQKEVPVIRLALQLFATQTTLLNTTGNDLSPEMKTFYHDRLIDNAEPKLVHDQFGAKYPIPQRGGKTIEFRRFSSLPKALTPLTEGVTPAGNKTNVTTLTAEVSQYGDYIEHSDMLEFTAIDRVIEQDTKRLGSQAGRTLDTVTREVLNGGTNKMFAPKVVGTTETEILLREDVTKDCLLTPETVRFGAAKLRRMNTEDIDDSLVAIIHTDIANDMQNNSEWQEAHKYAAPENLYSGEIGKIGGVRFVQTTEAKIIGPASMLGIDGYCRTKLNAAVTSSADIYPKDPFTTAQATAINARITAGTTYKLYVAGAECTVSSVTGGAVGTCKITLSEAVASAASGATVCGTGAGKDGSAIYCTILLGADAYGTTEISGMGLEHIVKQRGSAGTADPLNQRSTTGWKATKVAERLVEEYMLRIEHSCKKFGMTAVSN